MSTHPNIEHLPSSIPRLEADGSNWAIFTMCFEEAMLATQRWSHFDGTSTCPSPKDPNKVTETEQKEIDAWHHEDNTAHYLLSQRLPHSIIMRLHTHKTAKARWTHLTTEFTAQSIYAQNNLEEAFFEMRCTKGTDVCTFLASLQCKREELIAAGVTISQREYQRTLLKSLPEELAKFAAQTLTSACHNGRILDSSTLINSIIEESERLKNWHIHSQHGQGRKQKEGNADEALAATGSEGRRKKRRQGNCHYCGKPGHWVRDCRKKKSDNGESSNAPQGNSNAPQANTNPPAKSENKPVSLANAVVEHDFEGDGFWMAEEDDMTPTLTI